MESPTKIVTVAVELQLLGVAHRTGLRWNWIIGAVSGSLNHSGQMIMSNCNYCGIDEDRYDRQADRIRALEAALRPVANHMVIDKDNEFIGGCYAFDVVQTAKSLVGSVLEPLPGMPYWPHRDPNNSKYEPNDELWDGLEACTHEWVDVIDVCNRPCRGRILGWKCARCGEFDGTKRVSSTQT